MPMTNFATPADASTTSERLVVQVRSLAAVDAGFEARWCDLERRSLEGNAFLSAHFVMPAARHLPEVDASQVLVASVEDISDGTLLALGVFEECSGSRLLPLKHLRHWRCDYSFLDGLLIDRSCAPEACRALLGGLKEHDSAGHGVSFFDRSTDGPLATLMEESARRLGMVWHEEWSTERAAIPTEQIPDELLQSLYSKSRRKTMNRNRKRLEEKGDVKFRLQREATDDSIESFLDLEAKGWKGDQGSAMASSTGHADFCRELATGFASDDRTVFAQLSVDDCVIAASLNLVSGDTLFALKIGWDSDFADCSPGTQSEFGLLTSVKSELPNLAAVDSCSKPGSYVENVWPWKRRLTTGVFTTTMSGHLAARTMSRLKQLKRLLRNV